MSGTSTAPNPPSPRHEPVVRRSLHVRDVMRRGVRTCEPDHNLAQAGRMMAETGCYALPVLDAEGCVIGLLTDRDVCLTLSRRNRRPSNLSVREALPGRFPSCQADDLLRDGLETMRRHKVRRLAVVDDQHRLQGVLNLDDVLLQARIGRGDSLGPSYLEVATVVEALVEHCPALT